MRRPWLTAVIALLAVSSAGRTAADLGAPHPALAKSSTSAEGTAKNSDPDAALSSTERALQGRWQGHDSDRGFETWSLDVQGRRYRAEGAVGDWYEGRLVVRVDQMPGWIDFVIERCDCAYEGGTSEAVFGWQGESLLIAAPSPGHPRPTGLEGSREAELMRFDHR